MLFVTAFAVLMLALAGAASSSHTSARHADSTALAVKGSSCSDARGNSGLKECVGAAWHQEQKLMDKIAVRAEKYYGKALVAKAQETFQSYANAECAVAPSLNLGGSEYPLLVSRCEIGLTTARIQQLDSDITWAKPLHWGCRGRVWALLCRIQGRTT
ncbi:MAG: lysozyme inhibitor LprI family protein [Solirubrobacteraceae bacterium]